MTLFIHILNKICYILHTSFFKNIIRNFIIFNLLNLQLASISVCISYGISIYLTSAYSSPLV